MLGCADAFVVITALALEYGLPYYIIRRPQIRTDISDKFANTMPKNSQILYRKPRFINKKKLRNNLKNCRIEIIFGLANFLPEIVNTAVVDRTR